MLKFLILEYKIKLIHITLQTKYVIIIPGKVKLTHRINQINIAILKSPHQIHAHHDNNICIKKNINIHKAHNIQLNIAISPKLIAKVYLNIIRDNIIANTINISYFSFNHFNIIKYNHTIIDIDNNIDEIHIHILDIQDGILLIILTQLNIVCMDNIININHIHSDKIISGISKNNIS